MRFLHRPKLSFFTLLFHSFPVWIGAENMCPLYSDTNSIYFPLILGERHFLSCIVRDSNKRSHPRKRIHNKQERFLPQPTMSRSAMLNYIFAFVPLLFPAWELLPLLSDPAISFDTCLGRIISPSSTSRNDSDGNVGDPSISDGCQLIAYIIVAVVGFVVTDQLVPNIKVKNFPQTK